MRTVLWLSGVCLVAATLAAAALANYADEHPSSFVGRCVCRLMGNYSGPLDQPFFTANPTPGPANDILTPPARFPVMVDLNPSVTDQAVLEQVDILSSWKKPSFGDFTDYPLQPCHLEAQSVLVEDEFTPKRMPVADEDRKKDCCCLKPGAFTPDGVWLVAVEAAMKAVESCAAECENPSIEQLPVAPKPAQPPIGTSSPRRIQFGVAGGYGQVEQEWQRVWPEPVPGRVHGGVIDDSTRPLCIECELSPCELVLECLIDLLGCWMEGLASCLGGDCHGAVYVDGTCQPVLPPVIYPACGVERVGCDFNQPRPIVPCAMPCPPVVPPLPCAPMPARIPGQPCYPPVQVVYPAACPTVCPPIPCVPMCAPMKETKLVRKCYQVDELMAPGKDGKQMDEVELMRLVRKMVEPYSWEGHGGRGGIEYFAPGGCFVVRQTAEVHQDLGKFFDELKEVMPQQQGALKKLPAKPWDWNMEIELASAPETKAAKEQTKLQQKVYCIAELVCSSPKVKLEDAAQGLTKIITDTIEPASWDTLGGPGSIQFFPLGVSFVVTQTAEIQAQVELLLNQLRAFEALHRQSGSESVDLEVEFTPKTKVAAKRTKLIRKMYVVDDLLSRPKPDGFQFWKNAENCDACWTGESLVKAITETVAPSSWSPFRGRGTIQYYPLSGSLEVIQTAEIQDQVELLLDRLRELEEDRQRSCSGSVDLQFVIPFMVLEKLRSFVPATPEALPNCIEFEPIWPIVWPTLEIPSIYLPRTIIEMEGPIFPMPITPEQLPNFQGPHSVPDHGMNCPLHGGCTRYRDPYYRNYPLPATKPAVKEPEETKKPDDR